MIRTQPACEVQRLELVEVTWEGGPDGHDRPVDTPFVLLERSTASGWTAVDSDLGDAFQWTEEDGTYWARHEIAPDLEPGTYRLRIDAARYELTTEPFEVVANRGLIVRGVEGESAGDGTRLMFRAQHPPPDPERHMRYREIVPSGGSLRFQHAGESHEASWDPAAGGWVATVAGEVSEVQLDAGALVDGAGNTSGAGGTLRVGEVADVEWPPDMEVGGTGRDWHAHGPAHADEGRDGPCPADDDRPQEEEAPPGRENGAAAPSGERTLPATGGGVAAAGAALTLGAAEMARRSIRPTADGTPGRDRGNGPPGQLPAPPPATDAE